MSAATQYEYKTVRIPSANHGGARKKYDKILAEMSAQGWEFVDRTTRSPMWANHATFRRAKA